MKGKNRRKEEMERKRRRIIKIDKSRSIVNKIKMLQMIGKVNSKIGRASCRERVLMSG